MTEREFLQRVAARLGRRGAAAAARPDWQPAAPLPDPGPPDAGGLVERFVLEAEKLSTRVHPVGGPAEVAPRVVAILAEVGLPGSVVRWDDPTLDGLGLDAALGAAGFRVVPVRHGDESRRTVAAAEQAVAGVTGADAAVAETGTLVLASSRPGTPGAPGRGRTVSLLPPVHIAVLRREQVLYSALTVFRRLAGGPLPSQVVFASGPSRSADIENDLSIGVHGPKQVHVIIIGGRAGTAAESGSA